MATCPYCNKNIAMPYNDENEEYDMNKYVHHLQDCGAINELDKGHDDYE